MRRTLVAALIAVLAVAAWLAPAPEPAVVDLPVTNTTAGPVVASNFSNCAWAIADDTRETLIASSRSATLTCNSPSPSPARYGTPTPSRFPARAPVPFRFRPYSVSESLQRWSNSPMPRLQPEFW